MKSVIYLYLPIKRKFHIKNTFSYVFNWFYLPGVFANKIFQLYSRQNLIQLSNYFITIY